MALFYFVPQMVNLGHIIQVQRHQTTWIDLFMRDLVQVNQFYQTRINLAVCLSPVLRACHGLPSLILVRLVAD